MKAPDYYFTVSAGRSGQATLAALLAGHRPDACVAFEEPQVRPRLPGALGHLERHARRRLVETDELLGRGRVLRAFERGDARALEHYGRARMRWIERRLERTGASLYIDVSKHFAHGLHLFLCAALPEFGLIRLVRDPLENMRSYRNRTKNFRKDNNDPACPRNELCLEGLRDEGERYLWAWAESYLRFQAIEREFAPACSRTIRTEDLSDAARMAEHLAALGLLRGVLDTVGVRNSNPAIGLPETSPTAADVECFERFVARIPPPVRARLDYLDDYDPRARHGVG